MSHSGSLPSYPIHFRLSVEAFDGEGKVYNRISVHNPGPGSPVRVYSDAVGYYTTRHELTERDSVRCRVLAEVIYYEQRKGRIERVYDEVLNQYYYDAHSISFAQLRRGAARYYRKPF